VVLYGAAKITLLAEKRRRIEGFLAV